MKSEPTISNSGKAVGFNEWVSEAGDLSYSSMLNNLSESAVDQVSKAYNVTPATASEIIIDPWKERAGIQTERLQRLGTFMSDWGEAVVDPENPGAEGVAANLAHTAAGLGSAVMWAGNKADVPWMFDMGEAIYSPARDTELFLEEKVRSPSDAFFFESGKAMSELGKNAAGYAIGGAITSTEALGGVVVDVFMGALDNTGYADTIEARRRGLISQGDVAQGGLFAGNMIVNLLPNLIPGPAGEVINTMLDTTDVVENYLLQPAAEEISTFSGFGRPPDKLVSKSWQAATAADQVTSDLARKRESVNYAPSSWVDVETIQGEMEKEALTVDLKEKTGYTDFSFSDIFSGEPRNNFDQLIQDMTS